MAVARTIVETHQVAIDRDVAQARYPRFEEAWEGWTWLIARGPDCGFAVPGFSNHYVFKSHPSFKSFGVPPTRIAYRLLDADRIEIVSIEVL